MVCDRLRGKGDRRSQWWKCLNSTDSRCYITHSSTETMMKAKAYFFFSDSIYKHITGRMILSTRQSYDSRLLPFRDIAQIHDYGHKSTKAWNSKCKIYGRVSSGLADRAHYVCEIDFVQLAVKSTPLSHEQVNPGRKAWFHYWQRLLMTTWKHHASLF